jgi:hypothetical protein
MCRIIICQNVVFSAAWFRLNQLFWPIVIPLGLCAIALLLQPWAESLPIPLKAISQYLPYVLLVLYFSQKIFQLPMGWLDSSFLPGSIRSLSTLPDLVAGKYDGALRKGYYAKGLDVASRASLKVLQESRALTNQGITVSSRIDANAAKKLTAFLTSPRGAGPAAAIFNRFSKGFEKFVPAQQDDYKGHNLLAENMVLGW